VTVPEAGTTPVPATALRFGETPCRSLFTFRLPIPQRLGSGCLCRSIGVSPAGLT
jgi:hypothetical protein